MARCGRRSWTRVLAWREFSQPEAFGQRITAPKAPSLIQERTGLARDRQRTSPHRSDTAAQARRGAQARLMTDFPTADNFDREAVHEDLRIVGNGEW